MPYKNPEKKRENARRYYEANKEYKLAQSRDYYYANWEKKQAQRAEWLAANPEKVAIFKKKYMQSEKGKISIKKSVEKWLQNNPDKKLAHYAVHNALRRGELIRPTNCEICLTDKPLHGHHHKGYSAKHRLDVIWLCHKCHKEQDHAEVF